MYKTVILAGKPVHVELTRAAECAVADLQQLLVAEVHLILGCMVLKRVWFRSADAVNARPVTLSGLLGACFRTVRYSKSCRISHIDQGDEEPTDFPLAVSKRQFAPNWLKIDFRSGQWVGTFGYDRPDSFKSSVWRGAC
ncbi:MAG TPA: hypothetical protein ENJ80_00625 [Gammaproteobacteria bacterium]|nr:hypothetical protein [Gammaproteobacteria bacterium]